MTDKIESTNEFLLRRLKKLTRQLEEHKEVNKDLYEALEFYAGKSVYDNPWKLSCTHNDNMVLITEIDWEHDPWDEDYTCSYGGKKARETINKHKDFLEKLKGNN